MSGHGNEPPRGIDLNLIAGIIFRVADTIAKRLAGELAIVRIAWTRYVGFVLMALPLTTRIGGASFHVHRPGPRVARGMCLVWSSLLFVLGIRDVGLAEAATIGFIGPILVTFLSIPLPRERVDARRWIALAGSTVGVLVVPRPGTGNFHPEGLSSRCLGIVLVGGRDPDAADDGDGAGRDEDVLVRRFRVGCADRDHSVSFRPADRDATGVVDRTRGIVLAR